MKKSRITTPVGAQSTAAEVIRGIDLRSKRAIVTGSSSGIGIETARALASAKAAAKGARIAIASDFDGPAADGAPYRKKLSGKYSHRILKGLGHNVPQEAPQALVQAVIDVDGY